MTKTISRKSSVKASAAKTLGNPPIGYKTLRIEPEIRFYELEHVDKTEEEEKSEILIITNKSSRQLIKDRYKPF